VGQGRRQGLDAWDGIGWVYERFCGSYPCWSLATLEGQEAHAEGYDGHYYTWLKYVLRRLGIRVREEA
jgi:hypothetical protein